MNSDLIIVPPAITPEVTLNPRPNKFDYTLEQEVDVENIKDCRFIWNSFM